MARNWKIYGINQVEINTTFSAPYARLNNLELCHENIVVPIDDVLTNGVVHKLLLSE